MLSIILENADAEAVKGDAAVQSFINIFKKTLEGTAFIDLLNETVEEKVFPVRLHKLSLLLYCNSDILIGINTWKSIDILMHQAGLQVKRLESRQMDPGGPKMT